MNGKLILAFLKDLTENNHQEWFHKNKPAYEKARQEFEAFINKLIPAITTFDKAIKNVTAKECMFRIYRDIRFSKDKTPYKNNFGAFIAPNGKNSRSSGYYFHIEPSGSMIAGGIYMPPADVLKLLRNEIYFRADAFKKIVNHKDFIRRFGEVDGEKLVNAPKDFPKDFPDIELLKFKSYTVVHKLSDKELSSDKLFEESIRIFKTMYPFNSFLNAALEN